MGDLFRSGVLIGYAALFVWQLVIGSVAGREGGFLIYFPLALAPILVAGAPWCWVLLGFLKWISPPGWLPDLTVFSGETLLYHVLVLVSFAINVTLILKLMSWSEERAATKVG